MFKLTIEDDEGKTTVVPLARDEMTIGRLDGNTIRLTERNVSRRHARLVRQNGALFIEDLSSFTGVRVNGAKIASPTALREGDEVQIGDYRLALRGDKPAAAPVGDRPTMPSMPAAMGPMATVGGSMSIPTRASVAAMAAQPGGGQPLATATMPPMSSSNTPSPMPFAPAPEPLAAPIPGVRKSAQVPAQAPAAAGSGSPAGTAAPANGSAAAAVPSATAAVPSAGEAAAPARAPMAATPEVSEAQPTIPIRTLGESAGAGPPARMVALTTDIAGTEFPLDRPSLVIGRTDENDVVVNHRSISRHHAKIVRDGDHYTIVDLQSANGVRVNGEDYERIELNSGDVIELGHVRLRFVGPHDSFVFDPRASAARWRASPKMMIAGAATLVALVVVAAALRRGPHHPDNAAPPAAPAAAEQAALPPPAAAPAAPPVAPKEPDEAPAPTPAVATPAAILAEAREAAASEDWEKARAALDRLGTTIADPAVRRDATGLRRRVDTERQGSVLFAQFDEAQGAKNYDEALARYKDIPADSIYKRRARPRYDEARAAVVAEHLATAEKARAAGRCAEVRTEADEVIRVDPRNLLAKDMVRLCRTRPEPAPVAARPARPRPSAALVAENRVESAKRPPAAEPRRAETPRAEAPRAEAPAAEPSEAAGPDPDALMKQAREAWMRQQCGSAIDLSRKALHAKPGLTDAYQIIAVCSCTLKDGETAGRAYAKLDDKNRNLVHALCQKNGITVGE